MRLARRTEWAEIGDEHVAGRGQRMWVSDQGDHALLDVRTISFLD
ncbi:type VI secretion system accessory protein TagJ [Acidovorax sp. HMWF018]